MLEKVNRITNLIEKCIDLEKNLSPAEENELNNWRAEATQNDSFFKEITDSNRLREKMKIYMSANSDAIWNKTLVKIGGAGRGNLASLNDYNKTMRKPWYLRLLRSV